ncbi:hypothetical protein G7046_g585 [Stylonectria norvegica]|nr:hypothetical protein G7046_g585 [Stylonectria norvegica]
MTTFKVGNHSFEWTNLHLPRETTDPLRYEYDQLGTKAVERIQEIAKRQKEDGREKTRGPLDLYAILRDYHAEDELLTQLWDEVHTVPPWVDWEELERGQKFFYRYALANIMGFALQGFVGENSASSGVVEVLVRTGGFSPRVLLRRLLETFQLILQVTQSIESVQPGGEGHTTAIRVRLLHSSVRHRIMKLVDTRPDYYNVEKFGVPVNTLDSIHSITTFCCNHMWLQLPLMGVHPTEQDKAGYIALFRYVGYILGTPHEYFENTDQAKATMESMLVHELQVTPTSLIVGHNFVECLRDRPPFNISTQFIQAGSRILNGDEFCDSLGLGRPGYYAYACFRGHCWMVRTLATLQQNIPLVDKTVTQYFQRTLHRNVIHSKAALAGGSRLEFKHVPQLGKLTGKESSGRQVVELSFLSRPVELIYFSIFLLGCLPLLALLWGLVSIVLLIYIRRASSTEARWL